MTQLRVACLGAGYFSQFHYDSWQRQDRVVLVGSCDTDLTRAQATGLPAFTDLAEMLAAAQPDLLDIIVPPAAQALAIRTALALGLRQIICQKPFCTTLVEARAVVAEAERAGTTLIIHENFRFQPWYRVVKSLLDDTRVGTVLNASFRFRPGDGQGPDAYMDRQPYFQTMPRFLVRETAVHWIDTFRFLFGDPTAIYADLRSVNPAIAGEDAGMILFDFPGDVRAVFDGNRHLDHASDNLRRTMGEAVIEGTKGAISLYGDGSVWLRLFGETDSQQLLGPNAQTNFGGDCVHAFQSHVVDGILNGAPLENPGQDYQRVLEIEEAIYRSADLGQKISLRALI